MSRDVLRDFDAETHVPTKENTAQAGAWVPQANGQPWRAGGAEAPPSSRTATIDGRLNVGRTVLSPCSPECAPHAERRRTRRQTRRGRMMPTSQRTRQRDRPRTRPGDQRLRLKSDFDAVFRNGVRASSGVLALRAHPRSDNASDQASDQPCRFGFAISSRLGGAVVRNRIRRRLRESVRRLNEGAGCQGLDVVVIARTGAVEADFAELDSTLRRLVRRSTQQLQRAGGAS